MVIIVASQPRSCSSYTVKLLNENGYDVDCDGKYSLQGGSIFNKDGYFEQIKLSLLCDQLIRMKYGSEFSFLYPPKFNNKPIYNINYFYDIDETTLLYEPNSFWTWGLDRMLPGQKWYKCYSKFGVDTYENIMNAINEYNTDYKNRDKCVLKDPRLIFVLDYFDFEYKLCYLKRDPKKVKESCKKHYGTDVFEEKDGIVSNFFNHKIKYCSYETFSKRYEEAVEFFYKENRDIIINVDQEDIRSRLGF